MTYNETMSRFWENQEHARQCQAWEEWGRARAQVQVPVPQHGLDDARRLITAILHGDSLPAPDTVELLLVNPGGLYVVLFDAEEIDVNIRRTYTWGGEVAAQVVADYTARFGPCRAERYTDPFKVGGDIEGAHYSFDAGGMVVGEPPRTMLNVDGFRLGFYDHHASILAERLEHAIKKEEVVDGRAVGFVKVHGRWTCIALETNLAKKISIALKDVVDECERKADAHFKAFAARLPKAPVDTEAL